MAFPLAHPAAVLPFQRARPRSFSLPALIVGSLTPDLGYCFRAGHFSHSFFPGSFVFCLPVGALALALLYVLRWRLLSICPGRLACSLRPLCQQPMGSPLVNALSLLAGAWTHIALDSVTHSSGWLVLHAPWLRSVIVSAGGRHLRVYVACYMATTFGGIAWLAWSYLRWIAAEDAVNKAGAVLVAGLSLAIAMNGRGESLNGGGMDLVSLCWALVTLAVLTVFVVVTGQDPS